MRTSTSSIPKFGVTSDAFSRMLRVIAFLPNSISLGTSSVAKETRSSVISKSRLVIRTISIRS